MRRHVRAATEREIDRLWSAVRLEDVFRSVDAFRAHYEAQPWCFRVSGRGQLALLGEWKRGLNVLAMRRVWAGERAVSGFIADAFEQAAEHGFGRVLSPLLPEETLGAYFSAGMRTVQRVVPIQGRPQFIAHAEPPEGVILREGTSADIPAVADVDSACFGEFWRWGEEDLLGFLADERLAVAETSAGAIIGYTLAALGHGATTLTRLAVVPDARRSGVGGALLAESAGWAARGGAERLVLCTQVDNAASRRLYASAGLREIEGAYAFAMGDVATEGER
jgi:[ribosomal protein S18]-alanine N-acetyltransferase